jgi:hypothetical protein
MVMGVIRKKAIKKGKPYGFPYVLISAFDSPAFNYL